MTCKKAKFQNWLIILTMAQVQEHHGILCELNAKLVMFNNTLVKTMEALNCLHYMTILLTVIHTIVTRLTLGVFSLKEGVKSFYEYMGILANNKVNPLIVPPSELLCIVLDIKHNIHLHPRLALQDDPNDNIWVYYPIILYPGDKIEWCVYALFIRDWDLVREHCLVDFCIWHVNLTLNLDGFMEYGMY